MAKDLSTARTLRISAKCNDQCQVTVRDVEGMILHVDNGYAPYLEGSGLDGGDYLEFKVDLETGQIIGWVKPTNDQLNDGLGLNVDPDPDYGPSNEY